MGNDVDMNKLFKSAESTAKEMLQESFLPSIFYQIIHNIEQKFKTSIRILPVSKRNLYSGTSMGKDRCLIFMPSELSNDREKPSYSSQQTLLLRCLLVGHELGHIIQFYSEKFRTDIVHPDFADSHEWVNTFALTLLLKSKVDVFSQANIYHIMEDVDIPSSIKSLLMEYQEILRNSRQVSFLAAKESMSALEVSEFLFHTERLLTLLTLVYGLNLNYDTDKDRDIRKKIDEANSGHLDSLYTLDRISYASPAWVTWVLSCCSVAGFVEASKLARDVIPKLIALPKSVILEWKRETRKINEEDAKSEEAKARSEEAIVRQISAKIKQGQKLKVLVKDVDKLAKLKAIIVKQNLLSTPFTKKLLKSIDKLHDMNVLTADFSHNPPSQNQKDKKAKPTRATSASPRRKIT